MIVTTVEFSLLTSFCGEVHVHVIEIFISCFSVELVRTRCEL